MKQPEIIVKILKKGDKVLNVWPSDDNGLCIAVLQKNDEVYICSIVQDEKGLPRLEQSPAIKITYGDFEIESKMEVTDGTKVDVGTF